MAETFKTLAQVTQIASGSPTLIYSPASGIGIVRYIVMINTSGSAITVDVWYDADGTSTTNNELWLPSRSVPATDHVYNGDIWLPVDSSGSIYAEPSASAACNIVLGGVEIT